MARNSIFTKFDKEFDVKGLKEDLKNVDLNNGEFKEVPSGNYEVKVEKLELVESKKGKPMVSAWLRILDGEYKNSMLFMNQVVNTPFGLHTANEFLRALDTGFDIEFDNFKQYNDLILDVHEAIDGKLEFAVEYGETSKGFKTFKITDVFEVE